MDIQTLKNSLCNGHECTTGYFILKESGDNATLTEITMCDIPLNSLIIKMDKVKFHNLLKDDKTWGFNKHSDYLIVTNDKLVFIEMKSKKSVNTELEEECNKKFSSDSCSINYADEIFVRLLSKNYFFSNKESHYVLFYQSTSINKIGFSNDIKLSNKTPETFRKIGVENGATVSYNRVI